MKKQKRLLNTVLMIFLLAGILPCCGGDDSSNANATHTYSCGESNFGSVISITSPTQEDTYATIDGSITLYGMVNENYGVTWKNAGTGGSGSADVVNIGCEYLFTLFPPYFIYVCAWGAVIPLTPGNNAITIDAYDQDGIQRGRDCISVTRY